MPRTGLLNGTSSGDNRHPLLLAPRLRLANLRRKHHRIYGRKHLVEPRDTNHGQARRRRCPASSERPSRVQLFPFQSLDFYLGLGFEVFGEIKNHPEGGRRYFLSKRLGTSFQLPSSLSYETVSEASHKAGGRYEKHHKGAHRHCYISLFKVRSTGHSHYDFPRRILCNHLQSSPRAHRHRHDTRGPGLNDLSTKGSAMAINPVTDR